MPEVKNSFLSSKMNKDLDDRLVPSNEYRDALNISVGKAEDGDVGALGAVFGNQFMVANSPSNNNLVCIGQVADNQNNRIFQFWTDYEDPAPGEITIATSGDMRITVYQANHTSGVLTTLVSGVFLNFASNSEFRIYGANVLENLLFWTDNRNQPRKININKALNSPSYYTNEVQISVAKYAPVFPISVYKKALITTTSVSSNPTLLSTSFSVSTADASNLSLGMQLISIYCGINDYAVITKISSNVVTVSFKITTVIPSGTQLYFYGSTMSSQSDNPEWPGDPNYLKDKYVRFSYRYRSEDGEYSLMAPFTQVLYIPNQNGYFLNEDESSAYRSTVVSWMENYINNVVLNIELPDTGNNIDSSYKIISLDILYKESDALAVKVLETIGVDQIKQIAGSTNLYNYDYRSQKPYKTLPESQTVRVYDKTPVRARSQEIVGNRVIYGNFINQNTPPSSINYNLAVTAKTNSFTSWAEYPNHTLKQNRNYQAGIILADKFGRQSSVILSSNDVTTEENSIKFGGSTVYSPYNYDSLLNIKNWRGNTLAMVINSPITSSKNEGTGEPGLYATVSGSISGSTDGFQILSNPSFNQLVTGEYVYTFTLASLPSQRNYPIAGNYLRGKYVDYVKVITSPPPVSGLYTIKTLYPINDIYKYTGVTPDIKFSYNINPLGWYSYKIVVRQQQQDYYNVYLPGVLNGYPLDQKEPTNASSLFPGNETNRTAHIVLLNDNINKVPRDLVEVGPDQKQYRSSVELFGRVENVTEYEYSSFSAFNRQYYPSKKADVASTIATSAELNFLPSTSPNNLLGTASDNFYQLNTVPIVARISTVNKIGAIGRLPESSSFTMEPMLAVYETAPTVSLLDIFWESSSSGLISDINADVLTGSDITVDFLDFNFTFYEFQKSNGGGTVVGDENSPFVSTYFEPINNLGLVVDTVQDITMTVTDLALPAGNRTNDFSIIKGTGINAGKYAIKITRDFVFLNNASLKENYVFTFTVIDPSKGNTTITKTGYLRNSTPIIDYPLPNTDITLNSDVLLGPILYCAGSNGAQYQPLDPDFDKRQLQWSILDTSTAGWDSYFSIDPVTGVISLISLPLPISSSFSLDIKLTDAYSNSPGTGSLNTVVTLGFITSSSVDFCGTWTSQMSSTYVNTMSGYLNFWKIMGVGETIDPYASEVYLTSYKTQYNYPYLQDIFTIDGGTQLSFTGYQGTFSPTQVYQDDYQGTTPEPVYELYFSGQITTNLRTINIDIKSQYENYTESVDSSTYSCSIYKPSTLRSWKLTNNGNSTINWKALINGVVQGASLAPGNWVGSTSVYGGGYPCITLNSLTYGFGGTALTSTCV